MQIVKKIDNQQQSQRLHVYSLICLKLSLLFPSSKHYQWRHVMQMPNSTVTAIKKKNKLKKVSNDERK